ncbi:TetR family transcriptional regulator [Nocardia mangyaensis]|uniref:TetR family transcriptional regulator n=1 Tax=Nocardia mangyaensis TaxID=2213200 RepID=A0A1J0VQD2_9NOCA|nr:TetR/AcrR family transcriptional regulator [Nocardia mangyaensis]APE34251.1 TetR family transcriptional regulator [Nocardia mangyaensis]
MSTAGTKGVPRAERERQILDVAGEHIGHVGYAGLSVGRVAELAGVSKPLVYNYFRTKDGLYVACVERAAEAVCGAIEPVLDGPPDMQMAERTLAAIFGALADRPYHWNILSDTSHPADGVAAEAARAARKRIAGQAARGASTVLGARGVTDPVDLSALTEVWMGIVSALVAWWARHPEETAEAMVARSGRLMSALFGKVSAAE